ncbi:MAG: hypothetical protein BZ136_03315 [Methanosphaera sp. rholeuAM74]|nr:MAG: hypothetical protein BZ136_03315 [Methanosphaera sp. rholeuAM74]
MDVKEFLRNRCPIRDTVEIINRKWALILLWDMFNGYGHFSEFKEVNPDISSNVLSDTLKFLIEHGLVVKVSDESGSEYVLTRQGRSLNRVMYELGVYGIRESVYDGYGEEIEEYFREIFGV